MVTFGKRETHKLAGIGSRNFECEETPVIFEISRCVDKVRQHKCHTIYHEGRWASLISTMLQSIEIIAN